MQCLVIRYVSRVRATALLGTPWLAFICNTGAAADSKDNGSCCLWTPLKKLQRYITQTASTRHRLLICNDACEENLRIFDLQELLRMKTRSFYLLEMGIGHAYAIRNKISNVLLRGCMTGLVFRGQHQILSNFFCWSMEEVSAMGSQKQNGFTTR